MNRIAPSYIAQGGSLITPSATKLSSPTWGILCAGAGDVTFTTYKGQSITLTVTAGYIIPYVCTHVTASTASPLYTLEPK